jgi:hypothetical protein
MAIAYVNNETIVSESVKDLILNEFECPVVLESAFQLHRMTKGEYIRIWPGSSEWVSGMSDGEYRSYLYDIFYYFDRARYSTKKDWDEIYSDRMAKLSAIIVENRYYAQDDYIWHSWILNEISPPMAITEFEEIEDDHTFGIIFNTEITRGNFS